MRAHSHTRTPSQVDPKSLPDCKTLDEVLKIDKEASSELKTTNAKLSKIVKAATKNAAEDDSSEKDRVALTLKKALEISNTAEVRIDDRVYEIDNRYQVECLSPN